MALQKHLVIMVKNPRIGRAKTRLAREIGKVDAWRFYRHMVRNVPRSLSKKGPWKTWLALTPDRTNRRCLSPWQGAILPQGNGDLGQRMLRPARQLPFGAYVLIGTDVVGITPKHIRMAFQKLGQKEIVFGPAEDGGFWLVGHKRHPRMLNPYQGHVRWSHPETLNDCIAPLKPGQGALLDPLSDVDNMSDFLRRAPGYLTASHRHKAQ